MPENAPASAAPRRLSEEIADAAAELAVRIDLGEFDDLEETEMSELQTLAGLMAHWAGHALAMEQRLSLATTAFPPDKDQGLAHCN